MFVVRIACKRQCCYRHPIQDATRSQAASSQDAPAPRSPWTPTESLPSDQETLSNDQETLSNDQETQTELTGTQMDTNSKEAKKLSENVDKLRKHLKRYRFCQGVVTFLQDLPADLRAFAAP